MLKSLWKRVGGGERTFLPRKVSLATVKRRILPLTTMLLVALTGCALLSRQAGIPETSIIKVATAIEQAVVAGADSPIVLEDEPDFKTNLPELVQIVRRRQSRAVVIVEFKQKPCLGETARGLIKYVKCPECRGNSTLHARVANVILLENNDRWLMYETLAKANNLSASGRKRIQTLFHQVRIELARPGDLLQLSPGAAWTEKAGTDSP